MKKLYEEASVQAIADAIRAKAGTADTYKIADMPDAIVNLPSGGGATEPYIEETYDSNGNLIEAKLYGHTSLRYRMFDHCKKMVNISLPPSITSINGEVFNNCNELAITNLPPAITDIGNAAFAYCYKLSIERFPYSIKSIGSYSFNNCTGLTSITFEGTPTSLNSFSFINCYNLTTINVPWAEGAVANAPWGATNATINYNYTEG